MGVREIIWSNRAVANFTSVFVWYKSERGEQFAQKFYNGIIDTIELLARMPMVGQKQANITSKETYYSFLSHPRYRIIYRFTPTTLHIVAISSTMMKQ